MASSSMIRLLTEKGLHVFLFPGLAALLRNAIPNAQRYPNLYCLDWLGGRSCSEWLQRFQLRRDLCLRDVAINVAAAGFGVLMIQLLIGRENLSHSGMSRIDHSSHFYTRRNWS